MAFGMTTLLLNIHNAGIYEMNTMILAMGVFYGGIAQVIAGIMEWKKNSTFGMTAFLSYGLFWLPLRRPHRLPQVDGHRRAQRDGDGVLPHGVGRVHRPHVRGHAAHQPLAAGVFLSLTILFVLLAFRDWAGGAASAETFLGVSGATWGKIAGWEGIFVALSAIYGSIAQVWNELYGRVVLPLGTYRKK